MRQFMMDGDFFVGAALATSLTKLALRYAQLTDDKRKQNSFIAEAMLIMASIIHLGKSGLSTKVPLYCLNLKKQSYRRMCEIKLLSQHIYLVINS